MDSNTLGQSEAATDEPNTRRRPWYSFRWSILFWIALPFIVVSIADIFESFLRARMEHQRRLDNIADVKAGRGQVSITDAELLEMLADDPKCVANVKSVVFFTADLSDPRFRRVKELNNAKEIGFYDCEHADNVLVVAKDMESVEKLSFEVTAISDQSIQSFRKFPKLNKVHFEQIVPDATIDELKAMLPNVNVETPYPASKEH